MTPLSGIITKGLGLPAANNMIINYFSLTLEVTVTPEPPIGGGGGGPYPGPAWNVVSPGTIQNFYKPYSIEYQQYYIKPERKTRFVTVKIKFRDRDVERIYEVTEKQADTVVSIVNGVTTLQQRLKVTISNLRKMAPSITNLRRLASRITVRINDVKHKD